MSLVRRRARRLVAACAATLLTACGGARERVVDSEFGAVPVSLARPTFTLHDTEGRPFPFAEKTAGLVTFLEFGYTHCPDVCPVHLANLATVLGKLAPSERMRTRVVFVTVDPNRDSPAVLRTWLAAFDSSFIGLVGTQEEVNAAALSVGFGPATYERFDDTTVSVQHAAPVVVFTADDSAHVMYPFGTRQSDWARDLPRLLGRSPAVARGTTGTATAAAPAQGLAVERAYLVMPAGQGPAAAYFVVRNGGTTPDTVVAVDTPEAGPATMHQTRIVGGSASMAIADRVAVAAGASLRFAPGGYHVMVGPLVRPLVRGESLALTVRFAHGAPVTARARVITYADVDTATSAR